MLLLLSAYLILMGSILAFAIYEFTSGVAFQVSILILGGLAFAVLVSLHVLNIPQYFVSFVSDFATPLITNLVLVLVFMGMGLKFGWEAKKISGAGIRIFAAAVAMAFMDVIPGSIIFGFVCRLIFGWPWIFGAVLGTLIGETSAAVVVPYLDHVSRLEQEKSGHSRHDMKLTYTLKLESTMNSITLLLFVALYYNQIYAHNYSPSLSSFISTTSLSAAGVLAGHWPLMLMFIAGIPVLTYLVTQLLILVARMKLAERASGKLSALQSPSLGDETFSISGGVKEQGERQFRIGMMLYGIVFGVALLIFETIRLESSSLAGIGTSLFSLMALLYLGFFLGYLFPGSREPEQDATPGERGRKAFTGMLLFHEEFELLARIVFYFSVGVSLGSMILFPQSGAQPITSNVWIGIAVTAVIMVPAFVGLRLLSGVVGLPIIFFSRYGGESYRGDFRLVAATMPKGITVAAVAVLMLHSAIQYSSEIYILALFAVIISTVEFTFISAMGYRTKGSPAGPEGLSTSGETHEAVRH